MRLSRILKKCVQVFGLEVARKGGIHNVLESHLGSVFAQYQIDCVIDVGANAGQYGHFLRSLGYEGWIVSFEPVREVFERLLNLSERDPKWICYNLALGDFAETRSINVYSSTVFSSFLDARQYAKDIWKSLETSSSEEVKIDTLDNLFSEIKSSTDASNFYLKMDTQGHDLQVFSGAEASLEEIPAIQAEISLIHVYERMPNALDSLSDFNSKGYLISGMYPVNRDESLAVIEYDCVLVKPPNSRRVRD